MATGLLLMVYLFTDG